MHKLCIVLVVVFTLLISPTVFSRVTVRVQLLPQHHPPVTVIAEVVSSPADLARGLMYRRHLAAHHGMWFVMPEEVQHPFWMKNTYISLDIIFIGADYRIVEIIANTKPLSEERLRPRAPYRYVLEVPAGFARKSYITLGSRVHVIH